MIKKVFKYFPYGSTRSGSVCTARLFTGQRLDDTGLYYYGARYYDATMGRFISADTMVPSPANPQSFNRYSYCLNNPLKYVDPSGNVVTIEGYDVWDLYNDPYAVFNLSEEGTQLWNAWLAAMEADWGVTSALANDAYHTFSIQGGDIGDCPGYCAPIIPCDDPLRWTGEWDITLNERLLSLGEPGITDFFFQRLLRRAYYGESDEQRDLEELVWHDLSVFWNALGASVLVIGGAAMIGLAVAGTSASWETFPYNLILTGPVAAQGYEFLAEGLYKFGIKIPPYNWFGN